MWTKAVVKKVDEDGTVTVKFDGIKQKEIRRADYNAYLRPAGQSSDFDFESVSEFTKNSMLYGLGGSRGHADLPPTDFGGLGSSPVGFGAAELPPTSFGGGLGGLPGTSEYAGPPAGVIPPTDYGGGFAQRREEPPTRHHLDPELVTNNVF
jgi:hypothetical protein